MSYDYRAQQAIYRELDALRADYATIQAQLRRISSATGVEKFGGQGKVTATSYASMPFDYIVWKSGSTYYSVNRVGVQNSSASFTTILNGCLGSNNWVALTGDTFTLDTTTITVDQSGSRISGAGRGLTKIDVSGNIIAFTITASNCIIEDMEIDGNGSSEVGLDISAGSAWIRGNSIHNFDGHGVYCHAGAETNSIKISDNSIYNNGLAATEYQIHMGTNIGHFRIWNNTLYDGDYSNDIGGIQVVYGGQGIVRENFLWGFGVGIDCDGENWTIGPGNTLTGLGKGIQIVNSTYDLKIFDNFFWSNNWRGPPTSAEYSAADDQYSDIYINAVASRISINGNSSDGASHTRSFLYVTGANMTTSLMLGNIIVNMDSADYDAGAGAGNVVEHNV